MARYKNFIMSTKLIPELKHFDDRKEVEQILEHSVSGSPMRSFVMISALVAWILIVVFTSRALAGRFNFSPGMAQLVRTAVNQFP